MTPKKKQKKNKQWGICMLKANKINCDSEAMSEGVTVCVCVSLNSNQHFWYMGNQGYVKVCKFRFYSDVLIKCSIATTYQRESKHIMCLAREI